MITLNEAFQSKISEDYWEKKLRHVSLRRNLLDAFRIITPYPAASKMHAIQFQLDRSHSERIRDLSNNSGLLIFNFFMAALGAMLWRYTNEEEVIMATGQIGGTGNRIDGEANGMAFLNSRIAGSLSFKEVFGKLKEEIADVMGYETAVVTDPALHEDRLNGSRIFCDFEGVTSKISWITGNPTGFHVQIKSDNDQYLVQVRFDASVYRTEMVKGFMKNFKHVLSVVAEKLYIPLQDLDFVCKDERDLIEHFNQTTFTIDKAKPFYKIFEETAARFPGYPALQCAGKVITYQQLSYLSSQLACYLSKDHGIKAEDVVAVCLERSERLPVILLAIWKCGAAYLPIDPSLPNDRKETFLTKAKVKLVISDRNSFDQSVIDRVLPSGSFVDYSEAAVSISNVTSQLSEVAVSLSSIAYIIFTSGSSGEPKGVMVEQLGMINHLYAKIEYLGITKGSVAAQTASISFDISIWQMLAPLITGGMVVIYPEQIVLDPVALIRSMNRDKITVLQLVPSYLNTLLALIVKGVESFPVSVKSLVVTGEEFKATLAAKTVALLPDVVVVNAYGPTEASDDITHFTLDRAEALVTVPIGKPIFNTQIYIFDAQERLCPVGVKGEIYVSGYGVSRGYIGDQRQSDAVFINKHWNGGFTRFYKTGDIGRLLPDGNIEFFGRNDSQVKIRGYRVELGEIENHLLMVCKFREAVVTKIQDNSNNDLLCAYVTCFPEADRLEYKHIKKILSERVADYMIPSIIIYLDQMPLNANGKVDQKKLPRPQTFLPVAEPDPIVNTYVDKITEIWKRVLGTERVDKHDNFFEVGGHSLTAIRLFLHLNEEFGCNLTLRDIFQNQSIATLAALVAGSVPGNKVEIPALSPAEYYEISYAQRRLWVLSRFEGSGPAYLVPEAYMVEGHLRADLLENAWTALVHRHEVLRTSFILVDGEPKQRIHDLSELRTNYELIDLSDNPLAEEEAHKFANDELVTAFNLEKAPLARLKLLKLSASKHLLLLTFHHIISDQWTVEILYKELNILYKAFLEGNASPLPALTIQYKDYSAWHNAALAENKFSHHKRYWLDKFKGDLPIITMPLDFVRPSVKTYDGERIQTGIGPELTAAIAKASLEKGVTMFIFLVACVKALIFKYTGEEDIIVGTPITARNAWQLHDQAGFYLNTLALRTSFKGNESFLQLLNEVKNTVLEAYDHHLYPFDQLVDDLHLDRDVSRSPLFDFLVVFLENPAPVNTHESLSISGYPIGTKSSKFDQTIFFDVTGKEIVLSLEYNSKLFMAEKMQRLLSHLKLLIENAVQSFDIPISKINILNPDEHNKLIYSLNNTNVKFAPGLTVIDLFDRAANTVPASTALRFGGEDCSYAGLASLSNKIARYLKTEHSLVKGDIVIVLMPRSADIVQLMLGIMRAGGVYLPLNPNQPIDRIRHIIDEVRPRVVFAETRLTALLDSYGNLIDFQSLELESIDDSVIDVSLYIHEPAYIIYTSGSTGQPKGIIQTHRTLYNLISWQLQFSHLEPNLRFLLYCSFSFDASIQDTLFALCSGGALLIVEDNILLDMPALREFTVKEKVEILSLPFAVLNNFFSEDIKHILNGHKIKHIISCAEQLIVNNYLQDFLGTNSGVRLHNYYGPSETHVITSYNILGGVVPIRAPIGKPVSNTKIYILSQYGEIRPLGCVGELYASGDNLAIGYFANQLVTEEKFIQSPIHPEERLYKVGDMGRFLPEGNIEYLGRKDKQVKIHGNRVELGEVENCIINHGGIVGAVATTRVNDYNDLELVAYFKTNQPVKVSSLRNRLQQKLPDYMVPSCFIEVQEFPLNANGKINTKQLLTMKFENDNLPDQPASYTIDEIKICAMFKQVLSIEQVNLFDNFFEIGGSSMKVIRLHELLNKEYPKSFKVSDIFSNPTVVKLTCLLELKRDSSIESASSDVKETNF